MLSIEHKGQRVADVTGTRGPLTAGILERHNNNDAKSGQGAAFLNNQLVTGVKRPQKVVENILKINIDQECRF